MLLLSENENSIAYTWMAGWMAFPHFAFCFNAHASFQIQITKLQISVGLRFNAFECEVSSMEKIKFRWEWVAQGI